MLSFTTSRFIDLSEQFDRGALLPGLGPEQMLAPTETGGFANTLVYKIQVNASARVCHRTFIEGAFSWDGPNSKQKPEFAVGMATGLAGHIKKGHCAYHCVFSGKSLRNSKEISKPIDTIFRGQTTYSKGEDGLEVIRFVAFSIDSP